MSDRYRDILAVAVVLAVAAVVFSPAVSAPFIFDDVSAIEQNPNIRRLWPPSQVLTAPPQNPVAGRPVVGVTLAINYALGELHPTGYHLFNQACHALSAVVLFLLVRDVLRRRFARRATAPALAVALLWLVHPLQTETVAYTVQRTELLMSLFYLLTLWCAWRGFTAPQRGGAWLVGAVIACALGMGSKEVMVSAPLSVLLMDRALAAGSFGSALRKRPRFYAALAATWLILLLLVLPGPRSRSAGFGAGVSPWHYLLTQADVIVHYLRLVVWPHPLLIAYDWPLYESVADVWPQGLMVVALLGLTGWALWRKPVVGWLAATCFMILAPTSSVVPITTELVAERRMYLVLAPLIVLVLFAAVNRLPKRVWLTAAMLIAVTWATVSFVRVDQFNHPRAIWEDILDRCPRHRYAVLNMGEDLMEHGDHAAARRVYSQALEAYSDDFGSWINKGIILRKMDDPDEAERCFRKAIEMEPKRPEGYYNLGRLLAVGGDDVEAAEMFEHTIRCAPDSFYAWYELALARHRMGQLDLAAVAFERAVKIDPNSSRLRNDYGIVLARMGRTADAIRQLERALEIAPFSAEAKHNLDKVRQSQGEPESR